MCAVTALPGAQKKGRAAPSHTELLVDGDAQSIEDIRQAISCLKGKDAKVSTTIFAYTGRDSSKSWKELLQEEGITFRPVALGNDLAHEPTDSAIASAMQKIVKRKEVERVALLTSDTDFLDGILKLELKGTSFVVLIPERNFLTAMQYQQSGVETLRLEPNREDPGSRVRAILHADGSGSVQLSDRMWVMGETEGKQAAEMVMCFLQDLGYKEEADHNVPACAKFWIANSADPLTVFPGGCATLAVHKLIQSSKRSTWVRGRQRSAFFLPVAGPPSRSKKTLKEFGSAGARQIFRGGGPFVLKDSKRLTAQALRRLGYINKENPDEYEAMLCFVNVKQNKKQLRKLDLLPEPTDRTPDVKEKLHEAFLSSAYPGCWRRASEGSGPIPEILTKEGLLANTTQGQSATFEAMKIYAQKQGLPEMKTPRGLAFRINSSIDSAPTTRSTVEFRR